MFEVQQFSDRCFALNLQVSVWFLAVACKMQDRSAIEQRILDVGFGGDHHFYPKILLKFLFLDKLYKLIVL